MSKQARYYWWLGVAFAKKHLLLFLSGVVVGFIVIIGFLQITPSLRFLNRENEVIVGKVGSFLPHTLPADIRYLYTSSLIRLSSEGDLQPVLINSFETVDENKRFRIHLKTNLVWSDGESFTSKDISIKIKGVEQKIIDNFTIDFLLEKPLATFPVLLTRPLMRSAFVGIGGAYRVDKYVFSKKGDLESISLLPQKSGSSSKTFRFFPSEEKMQTAYKLGRIDEFETSDIKLAQNLEKWKNTKIIKLENYSQIMTLFFNIGSPFLSQREYRRSVAQLIPNLTEWGVPAQGPIPPTSWAFSQEAKHMAPNTSRAMATLTRDVLASQEAPLKFFTYYENRDIANLIKSSLSEAGLKIDMKLTQSRPDDFDLMLGVWTPPTDPDQYFFWHSTQQDTNYTGLNSPKVDLLLEEGRRLLNVQQRKKIYWDFQKALIDEVPAHFLFYPYIYKIVRK